MKDERNNILITFSGEQYSTWPVAMFELNLLNQRQGAKNLSPSFSIKHPVEHLYESKER